jgi:hypothetical protein
MSALLALPLLLACGPHPTDSLLWREHWELLVVARDGSIVDANLSVSNTGLLRAQGHLRAARWSEGEAPIRYGRDVAPVEVSVDPQRQNMRLGWDGLRLGEDPLAPDTWTYRARDTEASLLVHLRPEDGAAPLAVDTDERGAWRVEATVPAGTVNGWVSSGPRGGLVEGWGVLLHRGGDGRPQGPRTTALVMGPGLSIGLDQQGQARLSWARIDGQALPTGPATLERPRPALLRLSFPDGPEVEIRLQGKVGGRTLLSEHLTMPEQRLLALLGGWQERRARRGWAKVRWQGRELVASAMVVTEALTDWKGTEWKSEDAPLIEDDP